MKLFRKIHLWLSVPFGIIIALICFSGAMLVFEPELTRTARSDVYYVGSSQGEPLPMATLLASVKASLPDSVSITGVTVFADKDRTYQVNLSAPRRASVLVDQYSGRITGRNERPDFFAAMFRLHRWLLGTPNSAGKMIVGISTIVFVVALLTGAVIWWPRARRNFGRSMSVTFRKGWPGLWRSLHVTGGMYSIVLLLAMALTGLTWSFDWYRTAFYAVCGVEQTQNNTHGPQPTPQRGESRSQKRGEGRGEKHGEGRGNRSEFAQWQSVLDVLTSHNPSASQITVGPGTASVSLSATGNSRAADRYEFDPSTGRITSATLYADAQPSGRLRGWIYSLHTGTWGGWLTRILWFLAALFGASLPITGYYIWLSPRLKKRLR